MWLFGVRPDVPQNGGNGAQRREHDRRIGAGTMSRTGATCPCCGAIMTMADIRLEGRAGRLRAVMTAVVVDGRKGKEYRLPTDHERRSGGGVRGSATSSLRKHSLWVAGGTDCRGCKTRLHGAFRVPLYGLDTWRKLFTNRQLLASRQTFLKCSETQGMHRQGHLAELLDRMGRGHSSLTWRPLCIRPDSLNREQHDLSSWTNNRGEKIEENLC